MEERKTQGNLVFALDIGTRSVVGVVGEPREGKLKVLAVEVAEHDGRSMVDGQIDDIHRVANLARNVTKRLEDRLGVKLTQVSVAAAGRALQTQRGSFALDLPVEQNIDEETISRLEAGAVSKAEEALQETGENWQQMFLVGYTISQYRLDNYPLNVLLDHKGRHVEVDVVATFLPGEVVESLYTAMRAADLQVVNVTLEPIAAMNAAIPAELRLLNLALVDIGAGTTDIAICRNGSVVGYTMATIAGDEITEAIMKAFLVDFSTAETMKRSMNKGDSISYKDILGLENTISYEEIFNVIQEPMEHLAHAIADQVMEVNTTAPSAIFLAGGGSKLSGLRVKVAASLSMDEKRVAIAGNNFGKSAYADEINIENPEYTTPLGIAISAGLGLLNDSYMITLNGELAKLFRSGLLTVRDVLLMNGYTYKDMIGRTGKSLNIILDDQKIMFRGEPAAPAVMTLNGEECTISTVVHAGDRVDFTPSRSGADAHKTLGELLGEDFVGRVLLNNREAPLDTPLKSNDVILTLGGSSPMPEGVEAWADLDEFQEPQPQPTTVRGAVTPAPIEKTAPAAAPVTPAEPAAQSQAQTPAEPAAGENTISFLLNDEPLTLPMKKGGQPYYLMDLLEHSGIDFDRLDRSVYLGINGKEAGFQGVLKAGDRIEIKVI